MSGSSEDPTGVRTVVAGTVDERMVKERPEPAALIASRYKTARRIGKGGMGEVMLARDEQVGRDVAIKRMRAADPSERQIQRFLREASIQGRLEHPAIVPVHEIGRDGDGLPFFVMKKLAGTTLAQILDDANNARDSQSKLGKLADFTLQRILRAFVDVCLAVEFAHTRGVVHRDLKPDNIMLGDFGEVYVLDWGVAKIADGGEDHGDDFTDVDSSGGSGENATVVGTTIGTPGYMAPEQVRGERDIDGRTDVYTLGCLLYEILAGESLHPRGYDGMQSALFKSDNRPSLRPSASARDIPPELDVLCAHATTPEREVRLATARELGDRVQRFLDGDRDVAMRRTLAKQHLERALEAFSASSGQLMTGGDETEAKRSLAMREAAGALALDPALAGAAELVGRLMLEPPKTTPREVEKAITEDDVRAARVNAQGGLFAVIGGLVFTPLVWWMAPSGSPWVLALIVVLLGLGAISIYNLKAELPNTGLVVIGNAVLVVMVARMFSPVLVAPGLAAVLAMAMVFTPRFSWFGSGITITIAMALSVLVPLGLELVGWLEPTMSISSGVVHFEPPIVGDAALAVLITSTLYIVTLIAGASSIAELMRVRTRDSHRHLLMQAWQLRQLVPRPG